MATRRVHQMCDCTDEVCRCGIAELAAHVDYLVVQRRRAKEAAAIANENLAVADILLARAQAALLEARAIRLATPGPRDSMKGRM